MAVTKYPQDPPPIPSSLAKAPKSEVRKLATRSKAEDTVESLEESAQTFAKKGDLGAAVALLEDGARAFVDRGLVQEALTLYEKALALDPNRADLFEEMGKTYQQLGRFDAALHSFEGALAAYISTERNDEARLVLERMMRFELEDPIKCHQISKSCLTLNMTDKALVLLNKCLDHYEQEKLKAKFLHIAEEILSLAPDNDGVRARVVSFLLDEASVFLRYRLFDKSIQCVRDALEWDAASIPARELLVSVYANAARTSEAVHELLNLARTTRENSEVCQSYLWKAVEFADAPGEVFEAARELGFDLFKRGAGSLGNEPTDTIEDSSEELSAQRGVFANPRFGTGLLKLLQIVEATQVASMLLLRAPQSRMKAQVLVQNGAIVFGIRVEGKLVFDGPRDDEDENLWKSLDEVRHTQGMSWFETITPLARSPKNRHLLRQITARALLELSKAFAGQPIEIEALPVETLPTSLSFSTFDILKMCVEIDDDICPEGPAASYFNDVAEEVEQAWLIRRHALGQPIPLPARAVAALHTKLESIEPLGLAISRIAALTERLCEGDEPEPSRYLAIFTEEGPWCCVIDEHCVALTLLRSATFGTFLHRAQLHVDAAKSPEEAPQ